MESKVKQDEIVFLLALPSERIGLWSILAPTDEIDAD